MQVKKAQFVKNRLINILTYNRHDYHKQQKKIALIETQTTVIQICEKKSTY